MLKMLPLFFSFLFLFFCLFCFFSGKARSQDVVSIKLVGTSSKEQKHMSPVHLQIKCTLQIILADPGKAWSGWCSLIPHFHVRVFICIILPWSNTCPHAANFLSFSLLLSSLWSSFWEAVCPDTVVILLMSLKLWYTPTKKPVLVCFSCNALFLNFFQSIFISGVVVFFEVVRQRLLFSFYIFRKWSQESKRLFDI